jgi:hypothetical protein
MGNTGVGDKHLFKVDFLSIHQFTQFDDLADFTADDDFLLAGTIHGKTYSKQ